MELSYVAIEGACRLPYQKVLIFLKYDIGIVTHVSEGVDPLLVKEVKKLKNKLVNNKSMGYV